MRFDPTGQIPHQLNLLLNEGLELGDNLRGGLIQVTLDQGENTVQHGIGSVPIGFILLYKDLEGDVFGSRVDQWTSQNLFVRSSVPNQRVRFFVV